jgi:hypothetical protein
MNLNQKLILGLSFGCVVLSTFVETNHKSNFNPSYSSVQSVVRLNGGAQNSSSGNTPKISVPRALEQNGKVSNNSSSSVSNPKKNIPTPQPGNKIRYFPNENPGGSGSGNNGPEIEEWETKASCPNPDEIISNADFWNSYLDSKDFCPNVDVELDEDDDWSFKNIVEIPDEVLSEQRRRLLATQPTAKLDKSVQSKHTYSNSAIAPFSYHSNEGKILTIKNKELEKIVYAHSDDLDLLNFADRVVCPIQTDLTKFQRSECRAVTNSGKKEALIRMLELTTSTNPDFITRRFPMPSYPLQDALAYIDTTTNACLFFHADNGKLWSAKKLSQLEMIVILNNPNFENLN